MVDGRSGVNTFPLRKHVTASAIPVASTPDCRALINCVIELATGRSLAVCAARDDTLFFGFPAFKVADAKHRHDRCLAGPAFRRSAATGRTSQEKERQKIKLLFDKVRSARRGENK